MKGKKYNAAEKHFKGINDDLRQQFKRQTAELITMRSAAETYRKENQFLVYENARLNEWVDRLLEYTELSREDIKAACEKDKHVRGIASFFGMLGTISEAAEYMRGR